MEQMGLNCAIELTAAWRRADARKYLLQPGISIKNLGPAHDYHYQFFSRLEVLKEGESLATIEVAPDTIEEILDTLPRVVSEVRTTLSQAMNQVARYQDEIDERQEAEMQAFVKSIKSAVKWLFTLPK